MNPRLLRDNRVGGRHADITLRQELVSVAQEQHNTFHMVDEADVSFCKQIKKYWTDLRLLGFTSCVTVPLSAASCRGA